MLYAVYLLVSKNGKKYCQSKGFKTHNFSYSYLIFRIKKRRNFKNKV